MKKLVACAVAAIFGMSCAFAATTEVTRSEEVRVNPEVKRNAQVAKKKTKRAAKKAKTRTKRAAKRTSAAAHRGAQRTEAAAERAGDRTRAAANRVDVTPDNRRGEAVVERNR